MKANYLAGADYIYTAAWGI